MAKAKRRTITKREKKINREIKRELIEKGIIKPDKPKMNRKKYIEEAEEEFNRCYECEVCMIRAASWMIGHLERNGTRVSLEAVGVAKMMKLTVRLQQFSKELKGQGRDTYTLREQYDYIKDILDA